MRFFMMIIAFGLLSHTISAQKKMRSDTVIWYNGIITLADGSHHTGLISGFQNEVRIKRSGTIEVFSASETISFSFFDPDTNHDIKFISLEFDEKIRGYKDYYFFEILFEFPQFVILQKTTLELYQPLHQKMSKAGGTIMPDGTFMPNLDSRPNNVQSLSRDYEQICIMDDSGIQIYMQIKYPNTKSKKKEPSTEVMEKDRLYSHLGPSLKGLENFANENNLSFEKKEDFLKIMEHYRQLLK